MRFWLITTIIGRLLQYFSFALLIPALYACQSSPIDSIPYVTALCIGVLFGEILKREHHSIPRVHRTEAMAIVSGTWLMISLLASVPYCFLGMNFFDAFFESMSGLTTTGATIITDFSYYNDSFYLWRAMTQWFGGLGVISIFVVILPKFGIAGRQLFFAESSSAPYEKADDFFLTGTRYIWLFYTILTLTCALLLFSVGMTPFDAFLHALTTLAAGGFSPNPESIMGYANPNIEWVLIAFMTIAGASFPLQFKIFSGDIHLAYRDVEFKLYLLSMIIGGGFLCLMLGGGIDNLRTGLFQSASLISSTGFASVDYNLWDDSLKGVLIAIMLIGGCAGSAAGGAKVIRLYLSGQHILTELKKSLFPEALFNIKFNNRSLSIELLRMTFNLVALYVLTYILVALSLCFLGNDLIISFSASLACVGNIGPAFNELGPMGSFAGISNFSKIILIFGMWVGRLEVVTVIALLHPIAWRNLQIHYKKPKKSRIRNRGFRGKKQENIHK
jgi:trk system potassium uptake protein